MTVSIAGARAVTRIPAYFDAFLAAVAGGAAIDHVHLGHWDEPEAIGPARARAGFAQAQDRLSAALIAWLDLAPTAVHAFARADRAALDTLVGPESVSVEPDDGVLADAFTVATQRRAKAGRVATLLPRDLPDVLDPESTLRRYVRYRMPW